MSRSARRNGVGRRTFLRGMGACLAIPFLESLAPRGARASGQAPPKRIVYYYVPNGFRMDAFTPTGQGQSWQLSPILAPLAPHKDDVLVLSGLDNAPGNRLPTDAPAGAHFQQTAAFLTCTHVDREPFRAGKSIDQVAAEAIGYVTPHRSLQLGVSQGGLTGACGGQSWPCAYLGFVSWADATTPIAQLTNPQTTFETLFGPGALGQSQEEFDRRRARRLRILDVVHQDARDLEAKLSAADRVRLDQYLTGVDETEQRVQALSYGLACDPGEPPPPDGYGYTDRIEVMLDIMNLALQCDASRIVSFMTHRGGAAHGSSYSWVLHDGQPIQETFHTVSHHGGDPVKLGKIQAINVWEMTVFAGLLARMKAVQEVDGSSLLDNSIVFFSSEISDGHSHSADNLPIVVAGRGQGTIQPGRHVTYSAPNNVYADLHIALLHAFGVPIQSFGDDGTKPLPGLIA
jgi:hypothetical protein